MALPEVVFPVAELDTPNHSAQVDGLPTPDNA
jgi:hypothetical protein